MRRYFMQDKYQKQVTMLCSCFADWERGSTIPWSKVESVMGCGRYEKGGMQIIRRFRKRLLIDREIVTVALESVGLRLLTHEQAAVEVPARRQKRAYRQVNRGLHELAAVNASELSDVLRLALVRQTQNMRQQRLEIGRSRREKYRVGRKSQVNPVRPSVEVLV